MLKRHRLMGLRSAEKFVPDEVFGLGDERLARFLGVMYACDGHVYCSDRLAQIGYTTISERLAHDVQHLLLRLGIVATIRTLKRPVYEGTDKVAREIRVTSQESLRRFCDLVPVPGEEGAQARVLARLDAAPRSTNTDTLPVEIWDDVLLAKGDRIWAAVSELTGRPRTHNWHVGKRSPSRGLVAQLASDRLPHSRRALRLRHLVGRSRLRRVRRRRKFLTWMSPACGTSSPTTSSSTTALWSPTSPKTWR